MTPAQAAIVQAAQEAGVDPAYALAIAERESDFNPQAKASKTIRGIYQMSGELRKKYGVGESVDPGDQARGWMKSLPDIKRDMKSVLGRDPTDQEAYLGHHYGAKRAARTLTMDPSTPVDSIFTPQEMAANPHFARAATIGNLNGSVMGDVDKRMARFGGTNAPSRPAEPATAPASAPDLSSFGEAIGVDGGGGAGAVTAQPKLADLSGFGEPADQTAGPRTRVAGDNVVPTGPDYQGNFERNRKWSKQGNYRTELGDQEPAFRKWAQDNKVPFDVNRTGPDDYDMRGFYKGLQTGDPRATMAPNPNDGKVHYDDKWKTPYHQSFSSESQWAQPNAPKWNEKDQLVDPSNGGVVFDERAAAPKAPDLSSFGEIVQ